MNAAAVHRARRRLGLLLLLAAILPSAGCQSVLTEGTADVAGIAGAGIAGAVSDSAVVGAAVGLGVRSLAAEGLRYVERRVHRTEQDAIAVAAGPLEPGAVAPWAVRHTLPIEDDKQGEVTVSRRIGSGSFTCKEVVFSVDVQRRDAPLQRAFYTATICRDGETWRWASAEPATERWGGLQ